MCWTAVGHTHVICDSGSPLSYLLLWIVWGYQEQWENVYFPPWLWKCIIFSQCVPFIHAQEKYGTDDDGQDTDEEMYDHSSMISCG